MCAAISEKMTFSVTCLFYEIGPVICLELVVISMYFIEMVITIYFRQIYADKGVKTQNMAIVCDFDQTEAHFLAPYYQYMLQQCQT